MIANAPLVWSNTPPTKPGQYLMSTPLGKGWHIQFVRLGKSTPLSDLKVAPDRHGRGRRVASIWGVEWAPCPEDLL